MGATNFRIKKSSSGQYAKRKAARLNGRPMASRSHETAPWWLGGKSPQEFAGKMERESVKLLTQREIEANRTAEAFERFNARHSIALAA